MFKVKEGILLGGKSITGTGATEVLTVADVGTMAYQNSDSFNVASITTSSMRLDDIDSGYYLNIQSASTNTSDRQLIIDVDDASRVLRLTGNAVVTGTNTGDQVVSNGSLSLSIGSAGASNTTVTIGSGSGYSANTASNYTYDIKIGPALTNLASFMNAGGSGFIRKNGADAYSIDSTTYYVVGQALGTPASGNLGNCTFPTLNQNTTGIANKANTLSQAGNPGSTAMVFHWSGQGGQPTWLWGGTDGTNMYVYNPSNFSVSSATNATYATEATNNDFHIRGTNPTVVFVDNDQGQTRYVHHNGGSIGFLNSGAGWVLRCDDTTTYGTFSGNLTGNVTGNASTASSTPNATDSVNATYGRYAYNNGVYSGSGWVEASDLGVRYANSSASSTNSTNATNLVGTATICGYSVSSQPISYGGALGPQVTGQGGGAASISFHRPGSYAVNFGLDSDNQLKVGGWSLGATAHIIMHTGNFTSWASASGHTHDYATHRGEGTNYIDYSRYVYNNGTYSGIGWVDASDLGVRYANTAGSASASDVYLWAKASVKPTYTAAEVGAPSGSGSSTGNNTGDQFIPTSLPANGGTSAACSGNSATASIANKIATYGGEAAYKYGFTTSAVQNPGGSWGKAVMIYDGNGQTYGVRVDRADYADSAGSATDSTKLPLAGGTMSGRITGSLGATTGGFGFDSDTGMTSTGDGNLKFYTNGAYSGGPVTGTQTWDINITGASTSCSGNSATATDSTNATYGRYAYNNGAYSGSGWVEASDLGVRYANTAGSAPANGGTSAACSGNSATASNAANNSFTISGNSPTLTLTDNDDGQSRHLHHNSGSIGFLNSTANWVLRCDDSNIFSSGSFALVGELRSRGANLRLSNGTNGNGTVFRNDGSSFYILTTAGGDPDGSWIPGYPLSINLSTNNATFAGNVTAYSDERLKNNWKDLASTFISDLSKVKAGTYDRTDNENLKQVGVSAQSLQKVMPEAVIEDKDGMLSVSYGNAALVACVEMAKIIVDLKARIEILENI